MKKRVLFLVIGVFLVINIYYISAATYYVDATGGNDDNDGLSEANAWKTIAKVNSMSFSPGDNIYFKRGEIWREQLSVPSSGTAGNLITFGAYGTGEKPIFDGGGTVWAGIHVNKKSYIKIESIILQNFAYAGIRFSNMETDAFDGHNIVDNCETYNNGQAGIQIYAHYDNAGFNNNIVQNSESAYNGNGFYSIRSNNNIFRNCHAHHNIYKKEPEYDTNSDGHGFGLFDSDDCIVENSEASDNYQELNSDANNGANGAIIRYNYFHDSQSGTNGITLGNLGAGADIEVYYNLLINNGGLTGWAFGVDTAVAGNIYVSNNVMHQNFSTGNGILYFVNADNCYLKNNILYSDKAAVNILRILAGSITSDYNQFYFPNGVNMVHATTDYTTLAEWYAASGQDAHSISADPLFINPSAGDFHLQPTSLAIDSGTDVGLIQDFDGNPIVGIPDIGAYEYQGMVSTCSSGADTNTDNFVSMTELMSYIADWKSGSVQMTELMTAIGEWKNGC